MMEPNRDMATMKKKNALERFAPAILRVYHHEQEAFWATVLKMT